MLKTLQWYIARELFKTFMLTAFGLTLVFSLCGGVLNMIQAEVLTAIQVLRILMFVLPVAATLTLPVSALFACAIVYGRFAADNEFDACKASGINIHRLLAPAMALSVLTATFTFSFTNYVIPQFVQRLEAIVRADIQKVVTQALSTRGFIKYGPYVLHARQATLDEAGSEVKSLHIRDAAFLMIEKDVLTHCGTADQVDVDFRVHQQADSPVATALMKDVVALDLVRTRLHLQAEQPFSPMQMPKSMDEKPKLLNLTQLFRYLRHPTQFGKVREEMVKTRMLIRDALFYRYAVDELNGPAHVLKLEDDQNQYEIRSRWATHNEADFQPNMLDVVIVYREQGKAKREYRAERCSLKVKRGISDASDVVHITLSGKIKFVDVLDPGRVNEPKQADLEEVKLPAFVDEQAAKLGDAEIVGISEAEQGNVRYDRLFKRELPTLNLGSRVDNERASLLKGVAGLGLQISSTIHSRLAFSASALVMLVLAAGLAIAIRGGQVLTAFVISFTPGLLVVVLNIMGRQLAANPSFYLAGVITIWAGIGLLALADVIVLTRYLRR